MPKHNGFSRVGGNPLLNGLLESETGREANALGSSDLDLGASLGVDAGTGLAVHDLEGTEADQLEALALLDDGLDVVDDGVHGLLGVGLADVLTEGLLNGFNEGLFAHGLFGLGCLLVSCDSTIRKKASRAVNNLCGKFLKKPA